VSYGLRCIYIMSSADVVELNLFELQGRQLAAMGKESEYVEDQEDQCSGYSPSFFHFKPSTKSCKTTVFGGKDLAFHNEFLPFPIKIFHTMLYNFRWKFIHNTRADTFNY
jgi:hypothetical protein